jgi:hypothetical protein
LLTRARYAAVLLPAWLLCACAVPLLVLPSQRDLMWALLKPLVGFDPNQVNLFEQPMVKERLSALLGTHYEETLQLLRTADQLQQEGPLFFVLSRYTPLSEVSKRAGLVWNADSNQLAALVAHGDATEIFAELVQGGAQAGVNAALVGKPPQWPSSFTAWLPSLANGSTALPATH